MCEREKKGGGYVCGEVGGGAFLCNSESVVKGGRGGGWGRERGEVGEGRERGEVGEVRERGKVGKEGKVGENWGGSLFPST